MVTTTPSPPSPPSATDHGDEPQEQDQLEDSATGEADPEGRETFDIPA